VCSIGLHCRQWSPFQWNTFAIKGIDGPAPVLVAALDHDFDGLTNAPVWSPCKELLDLRALLLHRHQWVRMRVRMQNALQAIALANGLRRGPALWSYDGQAKIAFLPLMPHAAYRRSLRHLGSYQSSVGLVAINALLFRISMD